MIRMFRSEWLKIRRSVLWLLAVVSPLLAGLFGLFGAENEGDFPWQEALSLMSVLHAMLFLPLLTGVFAAVVCRYEHGGGGWKAMLAMPVKRTHVFCAKFAVVMLLLALTQLLLLAALLIVGFAHGFTSPIPWHDLLVSFGGGWVACLPLAALQLFVSIAFQSFAAPLAVNVILTLPNIMVLNSAKYAPYDPWAQPMLAMLPRGSMAASALNLSLETLYLVVLGSFCVFFAAGLTYFNRRAA
ncbi:ABC transporter permease [Cohnella lubricantis]|uniref:ABC transporter permease n=1 Tax=Cohnella lubricantis TaxID=2163172 RepID=A0A841TJF0_9BACL|nr:ABC transporter permease [Cohnella lubricantis]MBB6679330.1 ABC transporter permease [Cohnella lubricantis]MBP2120121.1 hypothetical protein [Cohnella lubricantis]